MNILTKISHAIREFILACSRNYFWGTPRQIWDDEYNEKTFYTEETYMAKFGKKMPESYAKHWYDKKI